jgi:hypothetical protein
MTYTPTGILCMYATHALMQLMYVCNICITSPLIQLVKCLVIEVTASSVFTGNVQRLWGKPPV